MHTKGSDENSWRNDLFLHVTILEKKNRVHVTRSQLKVHIAGVEFKCLEFLFSKGVGVTHSAGDEPEGDQKLLHVGLYFQCPDMLPLCLY